MQDHNSIFYLLAGLVAGYLCGRLDTLISVCRKVDVAAPKGFFHKTPGKFSLTKANVDIDDKKYVTPISTDALVKTTDTALGETSVSTDNIQQSVSKLAQLKTK